MKYLVLHSFRSFGVMLHKGEVVDEAAIRSPRLRRSEGKIIPAVSSSTAPEEAVVAAQPPQVQSPMRVPISRRRLKSRSFPSVKSKEVLPNGFYV